MASSTGSDPDRAWTRIERGLARISNEENRKVARTYIQERRAGGIRLSTLASDVNLLQSYCDYLGDPLANVDGPP